jgi:hypothetical protein
VAARGTSQLRANPVFDQFPQFHTCSGIEPCGEESYNQSALSTICARERAEGEEPLTEPAGMQSANLASSEPWYRRVSFWRSLAGMALAVAFGCAAVALETASELSSRSAFFYHRLQFLRARIAHLQAQTADADRYVAALPAERAGHADVNQVLSAGDATVIPLELSRSRDRRGMAVISRKVGDAIVEIAGLPPESGEATYVMWWLPLGSQPIRAADLTPDPDGRVSLTVPISPRMANIGGVIVTLEPRKAVGGPNGPTILNGKLSSATPH